MAGLGAEVAAVHLAVVLAGLRHRGRAVGEVAEVNAVLGQRQVQSCWWTSWLPLDWAFLLA